MKKLNKLYLVLAFLACAGTLRSQVVTWQQQPSWDAVEMFGDHLLKVKQSGKWGLADFDGNAVLPCNYARLTDICEDRFLVIDENGKLLLLGDPSGSTIQVIGEWFVDDAWPYFTNGLLAVRNAQKLWGYMDKSGKVAKAKYQNAFPFFFGYASVREKDKWHIINTKGESLSVTDGTFHQKGFRFASSFTKIDKRPPVAMVIISDKVYFVDKDGNVVGDIASIEGATISDFGSGNRFKCVDGASFLEIEVNPVVEMASVKKGNTDYECHNNSVEALSFPRVRGIDIENDGTIKVGELVIRPQFQESVVLTSERVLVKKDGKWGLLTFNLNEPLDRVVLNESSTQEICHNAPMFFQLKGRRENVCAYTIDEAGNMAFWDIDPATGSFYAPMHHLNEKGEAVAIIGLKTDGVLLEPKVFTKKVSLGEGFTVSGPDKKVIVTKKKGRVSSEIIVWNHSEQDAAPFDVSVDNSSDILHFDGLPAHQSVTIPVSKYVEIPPLEDNVTKMFKVRISETGMPEREYKVNVKFAIKTIDG